jgi:predicted nucleic acid-binding protein
MASLSFPSEKMILILDASTLIAFYASSELNEPNLIHQLAFCGYALVIPRAVFTEIEKGQKPTFSILTKAIKDGIIKVNDDISIEETLAFEKRHPRLHLGEIQVLLLGLKYKASGVPYYCSIDEGPGRIEADRQGISKKGAKGLIALLNEKGIIDQDKKENLLYRLDHCNFRA